MLKRIEGAIQIGQSMDTGNAIVHIIQKEEKLNNS
jgi:hypothetical protein